MTGRWIIVQQRFTLGALAAGAARDGSCVVQFAGIAYQPQSLRLVSAPDDTRGHGPHLTISKRHIGASFSVISIGRSPMFLKSPGWKA